MCLGEIFVKRLQGITVWLGICCWKVLDHQVRERNLVLTWKNVKSQNNIVHIHVI